MRRIQELSLWVGHAGDVAEPEVLIDRGILAVVDLAGTARQPVLPRDLVYCRFPLVDGHTNPPWLLRTAIETVAALLRTGTPTLVACAAGMSRAPSIAGAALAVVSGYSPGEGLDRVTQSGPCDVSPRLWSHVQEIVGQLQSGSDSALDARRLA